MGAAVGATAILALGPETAVRAERRAPAVFAARFSTAVLTDGYAVGPFLGFGCLDCLTAYGWKSA